MNGERNWGVHHRDGFGCARGNHRNLSGGKGETDGAVDYTLFARRGININHPVSTGVTEIHNFYNDESAAISLCREVEVSVKLYQTLLLKTFSVPCLHKHWVPGNEFSMSHVLYTHSPLESAHGQRQLQFCTRSGNPFSEFDPSRGERIHKYYAYCNSVKSLLIYVVF